MPARSAETCRADGAHAESPSSGAGSHEGSPSAVRQPPGTASARLESPGSNVTLPPLARSETRPPP